MNARSDARLNVETNFGGNQRWYTRRYQPSSEAEVLAILARHAQSTIRVLGSEHSWSNIAADADVSLDMSRFDEVRPIKEGNDELVRVGAGCRLQDLLSRLHGLTDRTLPTLGAITKQTVSGAISTGTHGSGRQSLSHFVTKIRAAVFDAETGRPQIREFSDGPALLAARCGLGCMGVILSIDLQTVPKFKIAETVRTYKTVEEVLALYQTAPLTQFLWSPYGWTWVAFERAQIDQPPNSLIDTIKTLVFRAYNLVGIDIGFHLGVILSRLAGPWAIKFFFKIVPRLLVKNVERIDESQHVLTMKHYYFRHEEMELFVRQSDLPRAMEFLRFAIEVFAGDRLTIPPQLARELAGTCLPAQLVALRGSYTHHYPLFCRRVMPDDTLISMTSSTDEPLFSVSMFTYCPPQKRKAYYACCDFLARAFLHLFKARPHWGKHFPLQYADLAPLYPRLEEFRALCCANDPRGVLRNGYTARVLALPPGRARD